MIKEASVGVGIRGVEGTSAVASSDYAIRFVYKNTIVFSLTVCVVVHRRPGTKFPSLVPSESCGRD